MLVILKGGTLADIAKNLQIKKIYLKIWNQCNF